MHKQDLKRNASSSSVLLSAVAFMLSAMAILAYFVFRSVSQPQTANAVSDSTSESLCQYNIVNKETLLKELVDLKTELGDEWSSSCQDALDNVLYETALDKAAEGKFNTSFTRLCQIPDRGESEYFEEAQFLFNLWKNNRNTSGENQEVQPLLTSFFQNYDDPVENCPAATEILARLSL